MTELRYIPTSMVLKEINERGIKKGYNRLLSDEIIETFEELIPTYNFPIHFSMEHNHKRGVKCEPHIRVGFGYELVSQKENIMNGPLRDLKLKPKKEKDYLNKLYDLLKECETPHCLSLDMSIKDFESLPIHKEPIKSDRT